MTNYKEILRLQSLGINNTRIAEACGCARSTVISTLQYATAKGLKWDSVRDWTEKEVAEKLLPSVAARQTYKMPDYGYVHREMQKSGVRLNLLWLEYCEQCRSGRRTAVQIHSVQQVLRRLRSQNQGHHAPRTQAGRRYSG